MSDTLTSTLHTTVLPNETIAALALQASDTVFEGTGGAGGLSVRMAALLGPEGTLVITDLESTLLQEIGKKLQGSKCKVHLVEDNFRNISSILKNLEISGINALVLDLGFSSYQIERSGRGFSFERDEPLTMTFQTYPDTETLTALEVVNTWSEESLADIIWGFGGERAARRVAKAIVDAREIKPIERTSELVRVIESVLPRRGGLHPATKTFQAIRMAVNDEVGALNQVLADGWLVLLSGGRMAVISFHEVEDRIVKRFFASKVEAGEARKLVSKPIVASDEELRANPRARSAKLRVLVKTTSV